jgi:putative SOS response-associated peptidase YedK
MIGGNRMMISEIDWLKSEVSANYTVALTQWTLAIFRQEGLIVLGKLHWGLVPHLSRDISTGYKMISIRSETIATKPDFREAFKKRRCPMLDNSSRYHCTRN